MKDRKPRYKPVHIDAGCDCPRHIFESTNYRPITTNVSQGHVPLIRVLPQSVEVLSFENDAETAPPYVAISHIRSQGLGNTCSNSLFMCQLERLQRLVNLLYSESRHPVPFWIDTACIPLTQPGKADALELLGAVYRRASIVLALDSFIQSAPTRSALEDLMTVKQSVWARRLWTVHEGALGPCVKFRFKHAAVSFDDILQRCSTQPDFLLQSGLLASRTRNIREKPGLRMSWRYWISFGCLSVTKGSILAERLEHGEIPPEKCIKMS